MADAAVEFLLGNLQQLLLYHAPLLKNAKEEVKMLDKDLRLFRAFLRDSSRRRRKDNALSELVRQIRDVVYEAEDIIDAFVTQSAEVKSRSYFTRAYKKAVDLHDIARQVERVTLKVNAVYDKSKIDFADLIFGEGAPYHPAAPIVKQENVVGFEDEAATIIGYLTEEKDELDVISITGMPGLGKTTLAQKIYHDKRIQYEFPICIWVSVSQEFTKRNVFLAILHNLMEVPDDVYKKPDNELAEEVRAQLGRGKFLIVMDDVWTPEDWNKIQSALPRGNSNGKILITSRNVEVARFANCCRDPHMLRFLTQDESWLFLQYEVFGRPGCPQELELPGRLIASYCDGLPLALVVIGGILAKRFSPSDNIDVMRTAWMEVSKNVHESLIGEDRDWRLEKIIALSYDKLPYCLRACFLYLGMFPEDYPIPAWKLVCMWIAEGFIQPKDNISLEEIGENYLNELINWNLVRVEKRKPDGKVKTCRIHNMLRDFCKNEARDQKENFFQEFKRTQYGFENIDAVHKLRRICIHSNVLEFISVMPLGPHVRSFICVSKEDITLPADKLSTIPASFKLLRVLDVKPIRFTKIPSDMYQLFHLRFITLSCNSAILPTAITKLWNLETLIVDTTSRTLEIKADIWKLSRLRHLKINVSATLLPKFGKSAKEGENLQTLTTISPQSCVEDVLDRARKLKKLGIRGKLALLLDGKHMSFDNLGMLGSLEKLKLLNDVFPDPASTGKLARLPLHYQFPPILKSLTLSGTLLEWTHMHVLALLDHLEVLKLKDRAFVGFVWESKDGGFRRLEVLHIGHTDLVFWEASPHHFPRLKRLELYCCAELKEVPPGLADIPTFRELELNRSYNAAASAVHIYNIKKASWGGQDVNGGGFELTIFPPFS